MLTNTRKGIQYTTSAITLKHFNVDACYRRKTQNNSDADRPF